MILLKKLTTTQKLKKLKRKFLNIKYFIYFYIYITKENFIERLKQAKLATTDIADFVKRADIDEKLININRKFT